MKKLLILLCLYNLIGCSNFSPRKDLSSNITFKNLSEGEHHFTLISIKYPKTYKDKIKFYKELNSTLIKINDAQKTAINLIISPDMKKDIDSLFESGWIDKEILAMKNSNDLSEKDIAYLNSFKVATPIDAGISQMILNKQYYLLLSLLDSQNMYNSNYLYTELDKIQLMESILLERNELIKNLEKLKNNFVYLDEYKNFATFSPNGKYSNISPIIFIKTNKFSGFEVLKNNILISTEKFGKFSKSTHYSLDSKVVYLNTPSELSNSKLISNSEGVSKLLIWNRVMPKKKIPSSFNLENKFQHIETDKY